MPKPVCVRCGLFLRVKRNGFVIEEGMPSGSDPVRWAGVNPGDDRYLSWSSYKLWQGDLWECRGCGIRVVTGMGYVPIAEHYEASYERERAAAGGDALTFVHDC